MQKQRVVSTTLCFLCHYKITTTMTTRITTSTADHIAVPSGMVDGATSRLAAPHCCKRYLSVVKYVVFSRHSVSSNKRNTHGKTK